VAYETYPCGRCINTQCALVFGYITAHQAHGEVTGGLHGRSEEIQTELGKRAKDKSIQREYSEEASLYIVQYRLHNLSLLRNR
jgi:hypothetical protein